METGSASIVREDEERAEKGLGLTAEAQRRQIKRGGNRNAYHERHEEGTESTGETAGITARFAPTAAQSRENAEKG
jgi:hypothetical protein